MKLKIVVELEEVQGGRYETRMSSTEHRSLTKHELWGHANACYWYSMNLAKDVGFVQWPCAATETHFNGKPTLKILFNLGGKPHSITVTEAIAG